MKPSFAPFSLLFVLKLSSTPSVAQDDPPRPLVLDVNHVPLSTDTEYYILPVIRGHGGGVMISTTTCPLAVIQDHFEVSRGIPVAFLPFDLQRGVIRESADVNTKFSSSSDVNVTSCKEKYTSVWRVGGYDEKMSQWYVTTGGVVGNPGCQTVSNWFKTEKFGEDYKLVFCPSVCSFCKVVCKDVGVYVEKGARRRLALSDEPFSLMFKKA